MTPLIQGGDIVEPLRERVLGRVVAVDVLSILVLKMCLRQQAHCWMKNGLKC
jgi:hypothetical protein